MKYYLSVTGLLIIWSAHYANYIGEKKQTGESCQLDAILLPVLQFETFSHVSWSVWQEDIVNGQLYRTRWLILHCLDTLLHLMVAASTLGVHSLFHGIFYFYHVMKWNEPSLDEWITMDHIESAVYVCTFVSLWSKMNTFTVAFIAGIYYTMRVYKFVY